MGKTAKTGIGGWLLFYVIWTAASIIVAIGMSLWSAGNVNTGISAVNATVRATSLATCMWYLWYAWRLYGLVKIRPGTVKKIKFMIIGTPVFNGLMPLWISLGVLAAVPDAKLGDTLVGAYNGDTCASLAGAFIIALCWLVYFNRSQRVRNTCI